MGIDDCKKTRVAIKMISKSLVAQIDEREGNSKLRAKLQMEVKAMQMLEHPNIVKIHEVIDSPEHVNVVLEYCQQGELFELIHRHGKVK